MLRAWRWPKRMQREDGYRARRRGAAEQASALLGNLTSWANQQLALQARARGRPGLACSCGLVEVARCRPGKQGKGAASALCALVGRLVSQTAGQQAAALLAVVNPQQKAGGAVSPSEFRVRTKNYDCKIPAHLSPPPPLRN